MKLSARILVRLVPAALLLFGLSGTAAAVPPLCADRCTNFTPCNQICWGPGPNGFGAVITCRQWGICSSSLQDDDSSVEAGAELADAASAELADAASAELADAAEADAADDASAELADAAEADAADDAATCEAEAG